MTLKSLECMYIPIFLCTFIPYIEDTEANQMFIDIKHGAYRDIVNSLKKKDIISCYCLEDLMEIIIEEQIL